MVPISAVCEYISTEIGFVSFFQIVEWTVLETNTIRIRSKSNGQCYQCIYCTKKWWLNLTKKGWTSIGDYVDLGLNFKLNHKGIRFYSTFLIWNNSWNPHRRDKIDLNLDLIKTFEIDQKRSNLIEDFQNLVDLIKNGWNTSKINLFCLFCLN